MQRTRLLNQVANLLASQRAASDAINRMGSAWDWTPSSSRPRSRLSCRSGLDHRRLGSVL